MRGPWSKLRGRVFPDHWSLLFGQIAFYSFVVVTLSGVFLMVFYDPSTEPVVYDGPYTPLRGVTMSRALDSTLGITFEVQGGLLMRQVHHWASLIMVAAILLHILRLFFTGAFRRPRRLSWLVVFGLLVAMLGAALTGTSLADDMASGTSLAVLDGVLQATPIVGSGLSALLFGGDFPGDVISRFYPLHIIVLPVVLVLLFVAGAFLALKHRPAQFAGPGRTEDNVVGRPVAVAAVKSVGLFCFVAGVELVMAATATINPVWTYGPADPANTSAGVGPAWYLAFLDGALRLAPGWEVVWWGYTLTLAILIPVAVCTLYLALVAVYPFIESWVTGDSSDHHLLERPRNNPTRTGIGLLRCAVGRGRRRHHGRTVPAVGQLAAACVPGAPGRWSACGICPHPADLHCTAGPGPRSRCAWHRDGPGRPAAGWRVRRAAPSGRRLAEPHSFGASATCAGSRQQRLAGLVDAAVARPAVEVLRREPPHPAAR